MNGKTSPAWREWYDQMSHKCLINSADSIIPKIGVNAKTTQLLNDINTNDVDYVDVTDEQTKKLPDTKKELTEKEFNTLINKLWDYEISLKSAQQKYKGFVFTDDQKNDIKTAGLINDKRLTEIIELVIAEKKELTYFEFYLDEVQMETLKNAVIDNTMKDEK